MTEQSLALPPLHRAWPLIVVLMLLATTTPFIPTIYRDAFDDYFAWGDFLGNVALFIPLGLVIGHWRVLLAMILIVGLSIAVETLQLWLPRTSAYWDLLANALGGACGYGLARIWHSWSGHDRSRRRLLTFTILATRWVVPVLVVLSLWWLHRGVVGRRSSAFTDWEPMSCVLGNEVGVDRTWDGTLQSLEIYDVSIRSPEHAEHLGVTHSSAEPVFQLHADLSQPHGYRMSWRFKGEIEPTVFNDPLPHGITTTSEGLKFDRARWTLPSTLGEQFLRHFNGRHDLSIVAHITPGRQLRKTQGRIFSMSTGADFRCFSIGQFDQRLVYRVRTPANGWNGRAPQIVTREPVLDPSRVQRVICSYDPHWMRAWVDNQLVEQHLVPALIRPNAIGRGLPAVIALLCALSALGAWGWFLSRSYLLPYVAAVAGFVPYASAKLLHLDRHFPRLPGLFAIPAVLTVLCALYYLRAWRTRSGTALRSQISPNHDSTFNP